MRQAGAPVKLEAVKEEPLQPALANGSVKQEAAEPMDVDGVSAGTKAAEALAVELPQWRWRLLSFNLLPGRPSGPYTTSYSLPPYSYQAWRLTCAQQLLLRPAVPSAPACGHFMSRRVAQAGILDSFRARKNTLGGHY